MRGRVALPPLGLTPLGHYFDLRGVPLDPRRWTVDMPLVATLDREERISSTRLWAIINQAGTSLDCGAELLTVRDNLRHAAIAATSIYLQAEDAKRSSQMARAFEG